MKLSDILLKIANGFDQNVLRIQVNQDEILKNQVNNEILTNDELNFLCKEVEESKNSYKYYYLHDYKITTYLHDGVFAISCIIGLEETDLDNLNFYDKDTLKKLNEIKEKISSPKSRKEIGAIFISGSAGTCRTTLATNILDANRVRTIYLNKGIESLNLKNIVNIDLYEEMSVEATLEFAKATNAEVVIIDPLRNIQDLQLIDELIFSDITPIVIVDMNIEKKDTDIAKNIGNRIYNISNSGLTYIHEMKNQYIHIDRVSNKKVDIKTQERLGMIDFEED